MRAQVFASTAAQRNFYSSRNSELDELRALQQEMRRVAQNIWRFNEPWKSRARELAGVSGVIRQWISEAEDDWK